MAELINNQSLLAFIQGYFWASRIFHLYALMPYLEEYCAPWNKGTSFSFSTVKRISCILKFSYIFGECTLQWNRKIFGTTREGEDIPGEPSKGGKLARDSLIGKCQVLERVQPGSSRSLHYHLDFDLQSPMQPICYLCQGNLELENHWQPISCLLNRKSTQLSSHCDV